MLLKVATIFAVMQVSYIMVTLLVMLLVMFLTGTVTFKLSQLTSISSAGVLHVFWETWSGVHILQTIPRTEKRKKERMTKNANS